MDADKKALLAEAVNELIEASDAQAMFKTLTGVHDVAMKGFPVRMTGRSAVLNPLLEMMLEDPERADRVMELIDRKRRERGLDVLVAPGFDRPKYMRELMADKRARLRRLVNLWNQLRPAKDAIKGTVRMEFERTHAERWYSVRLEREEDLRSAKGSRLTNEERTEIIRKLWADVDAELDALEDHVQAELRRPGTARGAAFSFKVNPKKGNA